MFECLEMRLRQGADNVNVKLKVSTQKKQQIKEKEKIDTIVNSTENKKFYMTGKESIEEYMIQL